MSPTITIDRTATIGTIDPRLFGYFVEHLGRTVYGGIYEPGSPRSDAEGYRLDVLEAVRGLAPTTVRYPGGNFASGYHWRDGIGPREQRPARYEHAWKAVESNAFGTHEFMTWARRLGTTPYFCANLGNGTPEEAAEWLEYCNGSVDTSLTRLRTANGAPEPFNIPIWGLGNELYGPWQIGCKSASAYAEVALEAARRMREVDPQVQLVACGWENSSAWNATILDTLAPTVDFLSLHLYIGRDDFATAMAQPLLLEQLSRWHAGLARLVCREHGLAKTIPLAWDEWNVWFVEQSSPVADKEIYTLRDALAVAGCLNALLRCADIVSLANLAILVNAIAPIYTHTQGIFRQTIYWPLALYRRLAGWKSLRPSVLCEGYQAQYTFRGWAIDEEIAYLDVSAALSPDEGTLGLCVVNCHADTAIEAELLLGDLRPAAACQADIVDGPAILSYNCMEQPDTVGITHATWTTGTRAPRYTFPPHSLTMLTIPLG